MSSSTMKALNYKGPFQVKVEEVDKPQLEHPDDIIVRVTTVSCILVPVCTLAGRLTSCRQPSAARTCSECRAGDVVLRCSRCTVLTRTQYVRGQDRCRTGHHLWYVTHQIAHSQTSMKADADGCRP